MHTQNEIYLTYSSWVLLHENKVIPLLIFVPGSKHISTKVKIQTTKSIRPIDSNILEIDLPWFDRRRGAQRQGSQQRAQELEEPHFDRDTETTSQPLTINQRAG